MASNIVINNATGIVDASSFRAESVVQILSTTTTTEVNNTTTSYVDAGLTLSITPTSTNSKILIILQQGFGLNRATTTYGAAFRILRDSATTVHEGRTSVSCDTAATLITLYNNYFAQIIDSPNTTSSVNYKVQGRALNTGGAFCSFQYNGSTAGKNQASTLTLIEFNPEFNS